MLSSQSDMDLLCRVLALGPHARALLAERVEAAGGLFGVFRAGPSSFRGALEAPAMARLEALIALATRLVAPPELPSVIDDAADVAAYFRPRLIFLEVESVWVLSLDVRGRPAGCSRIADGTLSACLVHPREVFAPAIAARAAAIILVHNHPSGDPEPSPEDEVLTARLVAAGELLGIPLVDHVIVARRGYRSLGGVLGDGPSARARSGARGRAKSAGSRGPTGRRRPSALHPDAHDRERRPKARKSRRADRSGLSSGD